MPKQVQTGSFPAVRGPQDQEKVVQEKSGVLKRYSLNIPIRVLQVPQTSLGLSTAYCNCSRNRRVIVGPCVDLPYIKPHVP